MSLRDALAAVDAEATPDTMRELALACLEHFKASDDPHAIHGVHAVYNALDYLDHADAMRAGFQLGVILALLDRPIAEKVARRDKMRDARDAEATRKAKRNRELCAQAEALLAENNPKRAIARMIADSDDSLSISQVRRILNRELWNTHQI